MGVLLSAVLAVCFFLDGLWAGSSRNEFPLGKDEIVYWVEAFDRWYAQDDLGDSRHIWVEFNTPSGAPPDFIAATKLHKYQGCLPVIVMNTRLRYPSHVFYNTPEYITALAHEVFHVHQGGLCMNNDANVEPAAEIGAFYIVAKNAHRSPLLRDAFIYSMRRAFILVGASMLVERGEDPNGFFRALNLSEKEFEYFSSFDYVGKRHRINTYWVPLVAAVLSGEDDIYTNATIPGRGFVDLGVIRDYLSLLGAEQPMEENISSGAVGDRCYASGMTLPPCPK